MFMRGVIAAVTFVSMAGSALAAELRDGYIVAHEVVRGSQMTFEVENWPKNVRGVMVLISGPKEYYAEVPFGNKIPELDLGKYGELADGVYNYEIRGGTDEKVKKPEALNNGRGKEDVEYEFTSFLLAGSVYVKQGRIVEFKQGKEVGSEEPTVGEDKPDTDSGEPPKPNEGEGKGDEKGADEDKG